MSPPTEQTRISDGGGKCHRQAPVSAASDSLTSLRISRKLQPAAHCGLTVRFAASSLELCGTTCTVSSMMIAALEVPRSSLVAWNN